MELSDHRLDELRQVGDPELDPIMGALARDGHLDEVNRILDQLIHNAQPIPEELPDNIEFWLRDEAHLPAWANHARLDRASAFFVEHGIPITLLLSTSGLVGCYAATNGVKVLTFSYRLGQNPYHRIAETGQFVLSALAPGGLTQEGGKGIISTLKVRLMHAAIRRLITESGRWDAAAQGVPICQEDLLGTLMVFSYKTVWGLRELGVRVSDQEAEDYLYAWRVIGALLGIDEAATPTTMADARRLTEQIAERQLGPSEEGVAMTRALLEMHADLIPGTLFDGIVPALIRKTVGDEVADWLQIPRSSWEVVVHRSRDVGRLMDKLDRVSGGMANLLDQAGIALLQREAIRVANYERGALTIPTSLREQWESAALPVPEGAP